jgi:hypothetical protein
MNACRMAASHPGIRKRMLQGPALLSETFKDSILVQSK